MRLSAARGYIGLLAFYSIFKHRVEAWRRRNGGKFTVLRQRLRCPAQRISSALIAKSNKAGRVRVCFKAYILALTGKFRAYEGHVAVRTVKIAQNIASSRGRLAAPARKAFVRAFRASLPRFLRKFAIS